VVFNVRRELAEEYLTAYIRGDGYVQTAKRNRKITLTTSSDGLFTDLKFLLTLLGRSFTASYRGPADRTVDGVQTRFKGSHYIYVRKGESPEATSIPISRFRRDLLPFSGRKSNVYNNSVQKRWLRENFKTEQLPEPVRKIAYSDAGALAIRRVEEYDSEEKWVYDIAVEGVERFVGGGAVALLHNSMDSAEMAGTLPDVYVRLISEGSPDLPDPKPYRLTVVDNGPGVPPQHVPSAFGKVFYGSKYVLRQSRGMFGLGGTMAILYGQITTNRPVTVTTSADGKRKHSFQMIIDIGENRPTVLKRSQSDADGTTGTRVDLTLEGDYLRASQKIGDYFKQTALVASYANITFVDPLGQITFFERATNSMPPAPKETLPHPYGIDVEAFKRIVKLSEQHDMKSFMVTHFHRVGDKIATKFLEFAGVSPRLPPKRLNNNQVVAIVDALQRFPDFLQPDAAVLSPVGEQILLAGMNKELQPEFSTVVERPPSSYSGFPFLVEVGLAYGGKVLQPGVKLFRFANRIPLLYDESSDVSFEVLNREVDWRRYHVPPDAPVGVITHICLPSYERVLASVDGRLSHLEIGKLIDGELTISQEKETKDSVTYVVPKRKITVPSVNPDTFKVEYVPVRRFMKQPGGRHLRITGEEGRVLNVSPEHPMLVVSPRGIQTKEARQLVRGDYLVAARNIPRPQVSTNPQTIDLVDCFRESDLVTEVTVVGAKSLLYSRREGELAALLGTTKDQIGNWRKYDRMPLSAYLKLEVDRSFRSRIRLLGRRSHGTAIPPAIKLDVDFARLLGFYLAEGCSELKRNNFVSLSFHRDETKYQEEVRSILLRVFGVISTIDRKKKDKAVQITAYNKAIALFFSRILGAGKNSGTKRIPDFVYSTSAEFIRNLLDTYFAGDGYLYVPSRRIQASSSSNDLAQGLFLLTRMVGLSSYIYKFGDNYRIDLQGGTSFETEKAILGTIIAKKRAGSLSNLEYRPAISQRIPVIAFVNENGYPSVLRQHIGGRFSENSRISDRVAVKLGLVDASSEKYIAGDVQFVRVQKVEVIEYNGSFYNIETARDKLPNYMHGFGIFSHNCSTRIPYKTVGKEYIADRPEIQREIRNAAREALRRLGIFLSRKGSMEAVQRRMNVYGKYLPLIARFSTDLAGKRRVPKYQKLVGEGGEQVAAAAAEPPAEQPAETTGTEKPQGVEVEQKKIDEYGGS
jgi:DNA topoisomerase-6 subunit B